MMELEFFEFLSEKEFESSSLTERFFTFLHEKSFKKKKPALIPYSDKLIPDEAITDLPFYWRKWTLDERESAIRLAIPSALIKSLEQAVLEKNIESGWDDLSISLKTPLIGFLSFLSDLLAKSPLEIGHSHTGVLVIDLKELEKWYDSLSLEDRTNILKVLIGEHVERLSSVKWRHLSQTFRNDFIMWIMGLRNAFYLTMLRPYTKDELLYLPDSTPKAYYLRGLNQLTRDELKRACEQFTDVSVKAKDNKSTIITKIFASGRSMYPVYEALDKPLEGIPFDMSKYGIMENTRLYNAFVDKFKRMRKEKPDKYVQYIKAFKTSHHPREIFSISQHQMMLDEFPLN